MEEVTTTLPILWRWVMAVCALIAAVGGAAAVLAKLKKPLKDMRDQIAALQKAQEDLKKDYDDLKDEYEKRFEHDLKDIVEIREGQRELCSCMFALIDHAVTGNSIEQLRSARESLNNYLLKR